MKKNKIIMPLGWLAGYDVTPASALQYLASEILGHAADLEHLADSAQGDQERNEYTTRAGVWVGSLVIMATVGSGS